MRTLSILMVLISASMASAQNIRNTIVKIDETKVQDHWAWVVTFDHQPDELQCSKAVKFLRDSTQAVVFERYSDVSIEGTRATVTVKPNFFAKSATGLKKLKLISTTAATASYEISFDQWLDHEATGRHIAGKLALFDSGLRGHKAGADDGITVVYSFKQNGKKPEGIVELKYSGGVYDFAK